MVVIVSYSNFYWLDSLDTIGLYLSNVCSAKWNNYPTGEDSTGGGANSTGFILENVDPSINPPVGVPNVSPRAGGIVGVSAGANDQGERYSRKVFVGGLPPDIDEG